VYPIGCSGSASPTHVYLSVHTVRSPLSVEIPYLRGKLGGELLGIEAIDDADAALALQQAALLK
jgi:hypothetical protein